MFKLKKILILSFRNPYNYGAELQVFALCKKLRMMGYDAETLNLARPFFDTDAIRSRDLAPIFNNSVKDRFIEQLRFFKRRVTLMIHHGRSKIKIFNSNSFHCQYGKFTQRRFRCFDELYETKWDYTHYIVGSDQVWNFEYPFSLDPYFLAFVKNGKKIAYSASIGHAFLPPSLSPYYRSGLQQFDAISMREMQGSRIVQELLGKEVQTTLDPTLLITPDEWRTIFNIESEPNHTIVIYLRSYCSYAIKLAKEIALRKGVKKILYISSEVSRAFHDPDVDCRFDISAPEFVTLISNAEFVITNSFHGTAFSVNFGKPFFTIVNERMKTSSRFYSLLEQTDLLDRICHEGTPMNQIVDTPIDGDKIETRLETLRSISIKYLEDAICL